MLFLAEEFHWKEHGLFRCFARIGGDELPFYNYCERSCAHSLQGGRPNSHALDISEPSARDGPWCQWRQLSQNRAAGMVKWGGETVRAGSSTEHNSTATRHSTEWSQSYPYLLLCFSNIKEASNGDFWICCLPTQAASSFILGMSPWTSSTVGWFSPEVLRDNASLHLLPLCSQYLLCICPRNWKPNMINRSIDIS